MTHKTTAATPNSDFYVTGGTMNRNAKSYVSRQADIDLIESLKQGKFCYVLNSRQMGKSSLMVRAVDKLKGSGYEVVVLDLTTIGQNVTAEQWYDGLQLKIGEQLHLERELDEFWHVNERLGPLQRWLKAIREVVLEKCRKQIVIFVDEVDVVHSLDFSTSEFFAGIRSLYNRREEDTELKRLNFCLIGVTTTSDLIQNAEITPLNIGGQRIELKDFTETDAAPLEEKLGRDSQTNRLLLKRILFWTGGHPYLTQLFCKVVAENKEIINEDDIDDLCQKLFLSAGAKDREDNLVFVRDRMLRSNSDLLGLLTLYLRILKREPIPNDDLNPFNKVLLLSGIVAPQPNGILTLRNRIYENAFDKKWATVNMPDAELRKQRAIYRRRIATFAAATILMMFLSAFAGFQWVQAKRSESDLKISNAKLLDREKKIEDSERELGIKNNALKEKDAENEKQEFQIQEQRELADAKTREANAKDLEAKKQQEIAERKTEEAKINKLEAQKQQESAKKNLLEADKQKVNARNENEKAERLFYLANIKNADLSYQSYDMENFVKSLDAAKPEYRGIEWDYLNQLIGGDIKFDNSSESEPIFVRDIRKIRFSPDGQNLLTKSFFDLTYSNIKSNSSTSFLDNKKERIIDFEISPDKKWLVYLKSDSESNPKLCLHDISKSIRSKENEIEIPLSKKDFMSDRLFFYVFVGFTEDSKEIIIIDSDNSDKNKITVQKWNIESKTRKEDIQTKIFPDEIYIRNVSPIGQIYLSAKSGEGIRRLFLDSKLNEIQIPKIEEMSYLHQASFSDDGKEIFLGDVSGYYIFNLSLNEIKEIPESIINSEKLRYVIDVQFSGDKDVIAVIYSNGIKLINLKKNEAKELPLNVSREPQFSFSPNKNYLAVEDYKEDVIVWDLMKEDMPYVFKASSDFCNNCQFAVNENRTRLALADRAGLTLWNTFKKERIFADNIHPIADESRLIRFVGPYLFTLTWIINKSVFETKNLQLWKADSGEKVLLESLSNCTYSFPIFSSDSKTILLSCNEGYIGIWSLETGKKLRSIEINNLGKPTFVNLSNDEKILILRYPDNDKKIEYYNFETGDKFQPEQFDVKKLNRKEFDPIISPDKKWIVRRDEKGCLLMNEKNNPSRDIFLSCPYLSSFQPEVNFSHNSKFLVVFGSLPDGKDYSRYVKDLETLKDTGIEGSLLFNKSKFSPSDTWLVSRSSENITYWNAKKNWEKLEITGCYSLYSEILFTADDKRAIGGCKDGTVRFWDLLTGQEVLRIKAHESAIKNIILSPDEKSLLTVSEKHGAKLWRLKL